MPRIAAARIAPSTSEQVESVTSAACEVATFGSGVWGVCGSPGSPGVLGVLGAAGVFGGLEVCEGGSRGVSGAEVLDSEEHAVNKQMIASAVSGRVTFMDASPFDQERSKAGIVPSALFATFLKSLEVRGTAGVPVCHQGEFSYVSVDSGNPGNPARPIRGLV
jgi:hypothetical protein